MFKTVAVDIDDTSVDLTTTWFDFHNAKYNDSMVLENAHGWGFHNFTPYGDAIYETLKQPGLYDYVNPIEGAVAGLRILRKNYRVVFVTANEQPSLEEKRRCLVRHGLVQHDDARKDVIVAYDKTLIRADILIDDKVDNVLSFPGPAILFARPWNEDWKPNYKRGFPTMRCTSWSAIPSLVDVFFDHLTIKEKDSKHA